MLQSVLTEQQTDIVLHRAMCLQWNQTQPRRMEACSLRAHFQLAWLSSQGADQTSSTSAVFQGFHKTHKVTLRPVQCILWGQHKGMWQRGNVFYLSSLSIFFFTYLPVPSVLFTTCYSLCLPVAGWPPHHHPPPPSLPHWVSLWSCQPQHRDRQWCCIAFLCLLMS